MAGPVVPKVEAAVVRSRHEDAVGSDGKSIDDGIVSAQVLERGHMHVRSKVQSYGARTHLNELALGEVPLLDVVWGTRSEGEPCTRQHSARGSTLA